MTNLHSPLAPEELQELAELREVLRTSYTPGWMILMREMEKFADDAHEDMLGAAYASDTVIAGLTRRWAQREAVVRGIKDYIKMCERKKQELLESTEKESDPLEYAENRTT